MICAIWENGHDGLAPRHERSRIYTYQSGNDRSNKPDGLDGHGTSVMGKDKGFAVAPAAGSATYIEGYCSFTGKHAYDLRSMPASE
jgi:hypothetical protein